MFKMLKYLKKSTLAIIGIIVLLVIQAVCDLSLPDYTSDIVNVGIQYGGIEDSVPNVIKEKDMSNIFLFMDSKDKEEVLKNYILIESNDASKKNIDKYPILKNDNVYELKEISNKKREKLNDIFTNPMMIVLGLSQDSDEVKKMKEEMLQGTEMDPSKVDIFDLLASAPQESLSQIKENMIKQFDKMEETMITSANISYITNEYEQIGIDTDKLQSNYILLTGVKMVAISLLGMIAAVIVGYMASKVAARLGKDLRIMIYEKVMSFSKTELEKFSTASLITRSTNDIQQIQLLLVMLLKIVFYAPILGIGGVIKVLNTNVSMTWILGVAVGLLLLLVLVLFIVVMPKFKVIQKLVDRLNLVTREILTGLPVIRAFSREKYEEKRFDVANKDLTKVNLFVNRVMSCMMPLMMFIMNGIAILIVWKGAHYIDSGTMQVGDMMAFIQYTMQIIMAFLMITMVSVMLPRASVSAGRIDEVLTTELVLKDSENPKNFDESKKGILEFKDVSFRYPDADEDVLENINFVAKPGETTAFIGSTGSGKSTLVNLIPRFFDVTKGEIILDGVNIKDVTQHDLRDRIGYVPQKAMLFSGTIESNLKYGKEDATSEEVEKAAQIAQAIEFIEQKPDKYNSSIAQGGSNVSGGQKQRLSIARAIAKKPELYIFDDSFSALDFKTDATLRKALKKETGDSTVLIVAQRISTILHADQIIVIDEGKVVGKGTHKELLKSCEVYREIASSQLSKEELENE